MSSKEFYCVPVYMMIAEDFGYGDIEFEVKLLNDIQKNSSFVILLIPE